MTLDDFVRMTEAVLAKSTGGIPEYLPTVYVIAEDKISCLEGVPETVPQEEAARGWIAALGVAGREYFLGFRRGDAVIVEWHVPDRPTLTATIGA